MTPRRRETCEDMVIVALVMLFAAVVMLAIGCSYTYRDYYEKGCCPVTNEQPPPHDQPGNRPYAHP